MRKILATCISASILFSVLGCQRRVEQELISAAAEGNTKLVETLLEKGANIEARANDDWTALTIAAREGHIETVELLLKKGAKVNATEGGGHTALFWADKYHHKDIVELLIKAGGKNE